MSNPDVSDRPTDSEFPDLLPERAFVVEFRSGGTTGPGEPPLSGRVEHVVSGKAARFESGKELLAFVRSVLQSGAQTKGGPPDGQP